MRRGGPESLALTSFTHPPSPPPTLTTETLIPVMKPTRLNALLSAELFVNSLVSGCGHVFPSANFQNCGHCLSPPPPPPSTSSKQGAGSLSVRMLSTWSLGFWHLPPAVPSILTNCPLFLQRPQNWAPPPPRTESCRITGKHDAFPQLSPSSHTSPSHLTHTPASLTACPLCSPLYPPPTPSTPISLSHLFQEAPLVQRPPRAAGREASVETDKFQTRDNVTSYRPGRGKPQRGAGLGGRVLMQARKAGCVTQQLPGTG